MPTLAEYTTQVQELINDLSSIDFTQAEFTSRINQARQRVALDTHCVRRFLTGGNLIPNTESYPLKGGVCGVNVLSGGSNYIAPIVVFSGGGGSGAAATVTVAKGAIADVTMTSWGENYSSTPDVMIVDAAQIATNWQIRNAISTSTLLPANAILTVIAAISSAPDDPVNIQWNSGAPTVFGDALSLTIQTSLAISQSQTAALYRQAVRTVQPSPGTFVTIQQLRLAMSSLPWGVMYAFLEALSANPADPASNVYFGGGVTSPGDAIGDFLQKTPPLGLGFTYSQVLDLYTSAATFAASPAKITNRQLRQALADPSYAMSFSATMAIPALPTDPVNIQWNSGAGTTVGDALYNVLATLTYPGSKSAGSLYSFAATFAAAAPGSGAVVQAVSTANVLDVYAISVIWGSQRPLLNWLPFGGFQAYCRASTQQTSSPPSVWTQHWEGNRLYFYGIPTDSWGIEIDAICNSTPLTTLTQQDLEIGVPYDDAVQYYAAYLCMIKLQQYQHADFFQKQFEMRMKRLQATSKAPRVFSHYVNMDSRMRRVLY